MPEMPEVEQVRKTLLPHIKGKTIKNIEINLARLIKYPSPEEFIAGLTGKTILDVGRRGKYLVLKTGENQKLIVHLRMTGSLIAQDADKPEPPYAKIKFELTDGVTMWFCDIRTFGTLYLVTNNDAYIEGYETLGPEPLSEGFTADYMRPVIAKSRKPIKTLILEQTFIAGLGNIYADECLANRGTTFRDYKDGEGNKGDNQNHLLVYGRKGLCCKMCGGELLGTKVGGRGTTYCPHCQK